MIITIEKSERDQRLSKVKSLIKEKGIRRCCL